MTARTATMTAGTPDRESIGPSPNPLGMAGIEYVEYTTRRPQSLGHVLEMLGFKPVARHRSREVLLYRQGRMNVVINTHDGVLRTGDAGDDSLSDAPRISALALRVHDARAAYQRAIELGAWDVPQHAQVMELNVPGIHGPGGSHLYFVDRWQEFSIFDIDFRAIPGVDPRPATTAGLQFFGVVQYIGRGRSADWSGFYSRLLGFAQLPADTGFGVLPKGTMLNSPCDAPQRFYLQLVEPEEPSGADEPERLQRIAFGSADVLGAVAALRRHGVEFVATASVRPSARGAITRPVLDGVAFELVHDPRGTAT